MRNSKKTDIWTPGKQKQAEALRHRLDIGGDGGIRTHDLGFFLRIQTSRSFLRFTTIQKLTAEQMKDARHMADKFIR